MRKGLGFHNRHSAGVFNPASLFTGGVQGAWYDPSDLTTLFQDSAGTTPVTAVEQPVGLMLDKRSTPYSVYFDGTGDYLTAANGAWFSLADNYTIEFFVYASSYSSAPTFVTLGNITLSSGISIYYSTGANAVRVFTNNAVLLTGNSIATNTWHHIALVRSGSGANNTVLYINGVSAGSASNTASLAGVSANGFCIGHEYNGSFGAAFTGNISNVRVVKGTAVYTGNFTPPTSPLSPITGTSLLTCGTTWSGNPAITRNGDARADRLNPFVSGTAAGNLAYQTTSASRPTLRARYNLLTRSEEFENAAWFKVGVTITAGGSQITAPDGTVTADLLTVNAGSSTKLIRPTAFPSIPAGTQVTGSVYLKAGTHNFFSISVTEVTNGSIFAVATVNLATGLVTKTGTGGGGGAIIGTPTCTPVGNGWFRVSLTATYPSGTVAALWVFANSSATPTYNVADYGAETWTAAGTETGYLWGAQLTQPAVFPSNTYQRVGAATDYATGAAFPPYLACDGVDDGLLTNSVDFTGTDKMLVVAGVTKSSDAAASSLAVVSEFSANSDSNNGTFVIFGSNGFASPYAYWQYNSKGTVRALGEVPSSTYAAPRTLIATHSSSISTDELNIRLNGSSVITTSTDQGTGNYGNYPLYIGRRNNANNPFNGNLYSLIIAGQSYTAGQISSTESWVAAKTPLGTI